MFDPNSILGDPRHRQEQLLLEAAWRFQLVAPLLDPLRSATQKTELRKQLIGEKHVHPWRGLISVSARSLRRWCNAYRQHRLKGLALQVRHDRGTARRLPLEALERAKQLFAEDPRRTVTAILRIMASEKPAWTSLARTTLGRHLRAAGLRRGEPDKQAYGKFTADQPNQLWQGDILHGPRVFHEGKEVTAKVVCWLDDHARFICHLEAFANERLPAIEAALTRAILKHGKPNAVLVDNGKVYSGKNFSLACSMLGIHKIHSRPYHPESKGKQERLFRTLRDQLLNEVENVAPIPLDRLNRLLDSWQEQYHTTRHSELKEAPRERFRGAPITPVPRELIEEAFLQWAVRRVSSQGIIDFAGQKYYVDPSLAGLQLIIRFDPYNVERIFLWQEGRKLGEASAETLINKTLVRQGKPAAKIQSDASERYLHSLEQAQLRKRQQELNLIQLEDNSHE